MREEIKKVVKRVKDAKKIYDKGKLRDEIVTDKLSELSAIREYLSCLATDLEGEVVITYVPEGLIFTDASALVCFNSNPECMVNSTEKIPWYIVMATTRKVSISEPYRLSDDDYCYYIDAKTSVCRQGCKTTFSEGYLGLIDNWKKVKLIIEEGIISELNQRIPALLNIEEYEKSYSDYLEILS